MKKYKVNVTKRFYQCGTIEVLAEDEDMAFDKASEIEVDNEMLSKVVWEKELHKEAGIEIDETSIEET